MKLKKMLLFLAPLAMSGGAVVGVVSCGTASEDSAVVLAIDEANGSENDKAFNQSALNGIQDFLGGGKSPQVYRPAKDDSTSFKQMYANIKSGSTIVAASYLHEEALSTATSEISGKNVILLDGEVKKDNIASVTYHPEQAAFIAGYVLGKYLDDNFTADVVKNNLETSDGNVIKVSTYGGKDIPTVTGFMGGFKRGIAYYKTNNANSKVQWVDLDKKEEHFSGTFAVGDGKAVSEKLIDKGVDIILPVAAGQVKDTIDAYVNGGKKGMVIGVDSAQEDLYSEHRFGFSILKDLRTATTNLLNMIVKKQTVPNYKGLGQTTDGSLDNKLVGISEVTNSIFKLKKAFDEAIANATVKATAIATGTAFDIG